MTNTHSDQFRTPISGDNSSEAIASEASLPQDLGSGMPPSPGVIIDKRFEIISFLGKGGMSSVYKARHMQLDRIIALKMLHQKLAGNEDSLKRFRREAMAVSLIQHPNIVEVYGFGTHCDMPFMAMEYLDGESLAELLHKQTRIPKQEAVQIFAQILDALSKAHEKGIIHRDLKPSNVMLVGENREVKLVDFGIAKILPESGTEVQRLTHTGALFGTVLYMSPEQCSSAALDARSDIYSMGCLMYEVIDGQPPLKGATSYETITKHLNEAPRRSEFLQDDIGKVILSALEKDANKRPQSALELKRALLDPESFNTFSTPKKNENPTLDKIRIALPILLLLMSAPLIYSTTRNDNKAAQPSKTSGKSPAEHPGSAINQLKKIKSTIEMINITGIPRSTESQN
ncbi:MAG: serine/threonine protein kinase, partial [Candidatus Obscuribacterales bacterium]|nr:serine/threonine protein kinase [Candidatus Obscuribacterales bacterium]